jgi:hypothetical protein
MDNLELNEHQTNIFEQVAHYNNSDINNYINNTEKHLQEQQKLNEILKTEVNEANVKAIESFIENNEIVIDEQLHIMTELFKSLEEVSENNKELVHMKEEYAILVNSADANRVAKKMRSIRKLKERINSFLVEQGIIVV